MIGRVRGDCRDAAVVARAELRARTRHVLGSPRQIAALGFMGLMFGLGVPLLALGPATAYGGELASGNVPVERTGAYLTALASVGGYFGGAGALGQNRLGSVGPLVRTSVSPTAASLGRIAGETVQGAAFVVPAAAVLLFEVGVGAGGPLPPLVLALAGLPVLTVSVLVGRIAGDLLRVVNRRLQVSLWTKAILVVLVTVAIYVGAQGLIASRLGDGTEEFALSIPAFLPGTALQAYASLALAPLGATPRPLGVPVAALVLLAVPLCLAVAVGIETRLLLAEATGTDRGAEVSRGVPRLFAVAPSTRVAWRYLLRTRRDPRMLAHLGPLLFGVMGMGASVFSDPRSLFLIGPPAVAIAGATVAGAAFCLNPLGDDADQLPLLLTSTRSVAPLLRGRALAGLVPGLAVAILVGAPLGLVELSAPMVVGQSLLAVVLGVAGAGTALGVGAAVPKFERREYMSVERAHPSMIAVLGFFFGGVTAGAAGTLLVYWTVSGAPLAPVALAWVGYLVVLGLSGGGGYKYAVRTFDGLTLDDV